MFYWFISWMYPASQICIFTQKLLDSVHKATDWVQTVQKQQQKTQTNKQQKNPTTKPPRGAVCTAILILQQTAQASWGSVLWPQVKCHVCNYDCVSTGICLVIPDNHVWWQSKTSEEKQFWKIITYFHIRNTLGESLKDKIRTYFYVRNLVLVIHVGLTLIACISCNNDAVCAVPIQDESWRKIHQCQCDLWLYM